VSGSPKVSTASDGPTDDRLEGQVDAVLSATRALVAIAARSLAPVDEQLTLSQWRVLVVVSEHDSASMHEVARSLGVHASTATRICDRLVTDRLLTRREAANDRRYVSLSLTRKGQKVVDRVMAHRRREIAAALQQMEPSRRLNIATAFEDFAEAAGAPDADLVWLAIAAKG
jgi:DNA-binding MarR family transcriptional regulator